MKRKLKKLSLVLGLILMASFTIGISKVSAAETKAIKFESRGVMEAIKKSIVPEVSVDMVDLENLTLNLTQEQIDSVEYFKFGARAGDEAELYLDTEKNTVEIDGVEYKKISLKGIENFKNIVYVCMHNLNYNMGRSFYLDPKFHIQIDLSQLENNINISNVMLYQDNFDYINVESLGKLPNLDNLFTKYGGSKVLKTKLMDLSVIFPLTTKKDKILISVFDSTFGDEKKMWDYIASNQDKEFDLNICNCNLTYVPNLKNVKMLSLYKNNIKSIGNISNINIDEGLYDADEIFYSLGICASISEKRGIYNEREDGRAGLSDTPAFIIPLSFQKLNDVTNSKTYNLPEIFELALKIDKISFFNKNTFEYRQFPDREVFTYGLPSWTREGTKIEVKGATLSADNKQVIFADDVKDGDVATVEVLGGIAYGTKLTLTYKAPAQEEKPAEDNKGNNVDDKKDETIIEKFYNFLEGANQTYKKGDNNGVTFRIDGSLELFDKAYVDSIKIDKSSYTLQEGSTIIKLNSDYVNTLSNGKHELSVSYTDGKTATTSFTILAPDFKQNPDTGVTSLLAIQAVKI